MAEPVDVSLRAAVAGDAEFLYELHRASLGDAVVATWGPWDDARQRELHAAWLETARPAVVVCDRRDAGVLDVRRTGDGTVCLARLELLPDVQKRGVGTRLVERVVADARRDGAAAVELEVLDANEDARRLYERLGFVVVSATPPKRRMRLVVTEDEP